MRTLADIVQNQRLVTMRPSETVQAACSAMCERKVGSVAVTDDDGRLLGIFTGRDAVWRVVAEGRDPTRTALSDVMTRGPETLSTDKLPIDALRLMWDGGFRHLPLTKRGRLVGVVSRGDFKGLEHHVHDRERELWEQMR